MREPGEAGPLEEAIAYRLVLMGLHEDDPMGYSATADLFRGGEQRVVNVLSVLAGLAINTMLDAGVTEDEIVTELRRRIAEKTLQAEDEGSIT